MSSERLPRLRSALSRILPPPFTDMNKRSLGIVALALIAAVCMGAFAIGSLDLLEHRYPVSAVFPDSGGLDKGSLVRLAGVEVGEVTGLTPDRELGQVVVRFEVDDDVHLGPETTADIALSTLLGGEYIRLGHVQGGPALSEVDEEDRRIPLERTSVPFSVNETFTDATDLVQAVDTDSLNEMVSTFADITTDSGPRLERVLRGLEQVAEAFNQREAVVHDLLQNGQVLSDTLADKDRTMVRLIDASESVLDEISRRRGELAAVLGDGSAVVQTMADLITEKRAELDRILTRLDTITDVVADREEDVDTLLSWAGPTFWQVSRIGSHGPWIDVLPTSLGPDIIGTLAELYPQLGLNGGSPAP
jgi:phospholipid/cholesterol/gamma-HCH transport system substrate-binding protein